MAEYKQSEIKVVKSGEVIDGLGLILSNPKTDCKNFVGSNKK